MEENNTKQVVYQKKEGVSSVAYGHNKGLDLFGGIFLGIISFLLPPFFLKILYTSDTLLPYASLLPYVLLILFIVYFSKKKRKFVVRGIVLLIVLIPIIAFGGCFLFLSSISGF